MHNFGPDRDSVPVRFLIVAQEPSEAGFDNKLQKGVDPEASRNYGGTAATGSIDSALQFAAREWLCGPDETFLLTDMAKCAVRHARTEPPERQRYRWRNCDPFLHEEANLFPELRAIIGVGGKAHAALCKQDWGLTHEPFKVMHWAARDAHQEKVFELPEEREIGEETIERYRAFMNERRLLIGKEPKHRKIGKPTKKMLAVYRKQFAAIRGALSA
jgi:hypothetical protein